MKHNTPVTNPIAQIPATICHLLNFSAEVSDATAVIREYSMFV
jgi:hypothetical protein